MSPSSSRFPDDFRVSFRLDPFVEYPDNSLQTKKSIAQGWYYMGNKVSWDHDGYFWYVNRSDDVIKNSRYLLGQSEVESVLLEHPAVQKAAAIGLSDRIRRLIVMLCIVPNNGMNRENSLLRKSRIT